MFDIIIDVLRQYVELFAGLAGDCWTDWVNDPKPYRYCYAGLFGLYLSGWLGAAHRPVSGLGAALYLALYLL